MNQIELQAADLDDFAGEMPTGGVLTLPGYGNRLVYSIDTDNSVMLQIGGEENRCLWLNRKDIKSLRKLLKNLLLEIA